jgi:protein TonB
VAARPPEPTEGRTPTGPAAGRPAAPAPGGAEAPRESILSGQGFSLLGSRLEVPPVASLPSSGTGGTSQEGSGSGSTGRERDGQPVVPLDTPDPRYADYFLEIKRRIEANWVYPQEAIRRNQSGQGVVEFVLRKDGSLRLVEIVHSSGVAILDRYMENAIKFAAPFPPMPTVFGTETIPVSLSFTYVLGGFRVFGFR